LFFSGSCFAELYGIGIVEVFELGLLAFPDPILSSIHVFGYLVYLGFFPEFSKDICCCNFFFVVTIAKAILANKTKFPDLKILRCLYDDGQLPAIFTGYAAQRDIL
ncbi:hypothetical protein ACJX0J_021864, partial [Zea mays]